MAPSAALKIDQGELPEHACCMASPHSWIEGEALSQLSRVAKLPNCVHAAGMPDLHPGPGIPIGAAFAFAGVIRPQLVGSDGGCGVRMTVLRRSRHRAEAIARRIRALTDAPPLREVAPQRLVEAAWYGGPAALAEVEGLPGPLRDLAAQEVDEGPPSGPLPEGADGVRLGTIGGGNHFLEVGRVKQVVDSPKPEEPQDSR